MYKLFFLCIIMLFLSVGAAHAETITIYGSKGDGQLSTPASIDWNETHSAETGVDIYDDITAVSVTSRIGQNGLKNIVRGFFVFDTSTIPDNAVITKIEFRGYVVGFDNDFDDQYSYVGLYEGFQDSVFGVTETDIQKCGNSLANPAELAENIPIGIVPIGSFVSTQFNQEGINVINKEGYTKICIRDGHDAENVDLGSEGSFVYSRMGFRSADWPDQSQHPQLIIEYTLADDEAPIEAPTDLQQFRIDGVTSLTDGGEIVGNGMVVSAEMGVDVDGIARALEVELIELGKAFSGTDTVTSVFTTAPTTTVVITEFFPSADRYTENNSGDFKWRARTVDAEGARSAWVEFGYDAADVRVTEVPLVTQRTSPFPSETLTAAWASTTYAGGRASTTGDCGLTIAQCGCVLSSLSTLGYFHGLTTGIDGSTISPKNLNDWLLANDGYTKDGSILWAKALQYFGSKSDDTTKSYFTFAGHNVTDAAKVKSQLQSGQPTVAYSLVPGGYRHYYVLDNILDVGYEVSDPFWYNTKTANDFRSAAGKTQDYNNKFSGAQLLTFNDGAVATLDPMLEIHLASPAELLIVDSDGRRLGYDPRTNTEYDEIPGGQYDYEASLYSGDEQPATPSHVRKVARIFNPESVQYRIQVIGTGAGDYDVSIFKLQADGSSTLDEFSEIMYENKIDTYIVNFANEDSFPRLRAYLEWLRSHLDELPKRLAQLVVVRIEQVEAKLEQDVIVLSKSQERFLKRWHDNPHKAKVLASLSILWQLSKDN